MSRATLIETLKKAKEQYTERIDATSSDALKALLSDELRRLGVELTILENNTGEQPDAYEDIVAWLKQLPLTWYPGMLIELVTAAYERKVFQPGGAGYTVFNTEVKLGEWQKKRWRMTPPHTLLEAMQCVGDHLFCFPLQLAIDGRNRQFTLLEVTFPMECGTVDQQLSYMHQLMLKSNAVKPGDDDNPEFIEAMKFVYQKVDGIFRCPDGYYHRFVSQLTPGTHVWHPDRPDLVLESRQLTERGVQLVFEGGFAPLRSYGDSVFIRDIREVIKGKRADDKQ